MSVQTSSDRKLELIADAIRSWTLEDIDDEAVIRKIIGILVMS